MYKRQLFKFVKDWWPVMVAGILAIFGPILGPGAWVIGVGALVWWGFNRIQAVIKFITDIFKNVFDFLTLGLFKGKDDPKKVGDSVLKDTESEFLPELYLAHSDRDAGFPLVFEFLKPDLKP